MVLSFCHIFIFNKNLHYDYDQAAHSKKITYSKRESWAENSSDLSMFKSIFIALHSSNLRWSFGKTYNFDDILSFLWI